MKSQYLLIYQQPVKEPPTGLARHDAKRRFNAAKPSALSLLLKSANASATAQPMQSGIVQSCD
jgi:hypothetical protein